MGEQVVLKQSVNNLVGFGRVVSQEHEGYKAKSGKDMFKLKMLVETKDGDKVNNHFIEKNTTVGNKIHKGLLTVVNEYKKGDLIRISGDVDVNEWVKEDVVNSMVKLNGTFFTRIEEDKIESTKELMEAKVEMVITGIDPELDIDSLPTGNLLVSGMSVGYNNRISVFENLIVDKKIAKPFEKLYSVGQTGVLNLRFHNYAVVKEEETADITLGFGEDNEEISTSTAKSYERKIEVFGGSQPITDGTEYTPEDVEHMERFRNLALQASRDNAKKKQNGAKQSSPQAGFGQEVGQSKVEAPVDFLEDDDDMPNW